MSTKDTMISVGLLAAGGVAIAAASGVYGKGSRSKMNAQGLISRLSQIPGVSRAFVSDTWHDGYNRITVVLKTQGTIPVTVEARGAHQNLHQISDYAKTAAAVRAAAKASGLFVEGVVGPKKIYEYVRPQYRRAGDKRESGFDGKEMYVEVYEGKGSAAKRSAQDVYRQRRMPALDPSEFPAIPGMQGPFRYEGGDVLYYDPREGKYYDRRRDMYVGPPGKGSRSKMNAQGLISRLSQIPGVSRAFVSDTWHDGYNRITVVLKTQGTIPVTVEARGAHQNLHQISDYAKTAAAVRAAAKASGLFVEGVVGPKKIYEYVRPQYRRAGDKRESGFDGKEMYVEVYEGKGSMTRDGSYEATLMFDADEDDPTRIAQQRLMASPFAQQARPLTAEPPRITSAQGSTARGSSSVLRGMTSKAGTPIPGPSLKTLDERLNLGGEEGKSLKYFMQAGKRQAALDYADELLGGNGIEYIESQQDTMRHREGLSYVNMGDTYDTTLIYDHKTGRFYVGAWGDWVERYPKRFG